jgi:hypothetical protein
MKLPAGTISRRQFFLSRTVLKDRFFVKNCLGLVVAERFFRREKLVYLCKESARSRSTRGELPLAGLVQMGTKVQGQVPLHFFSATIF